MAVTIPDGWGQASLVFTASGIADRIVTTIGFTDDLAPDPSDSAHAVYDAWSGATAPFSAAMMVSGWIFEGVGVTIMRGGVEFVGQWMVQKVGSQGASSLPVNCAFLVRKTTTRGGRKGRGRMFLPPTRGGEDQVNIAGVLDPNLVIGVTNACEAARVAMVTAGVSPALLHEDGSTPNLISGLACASILGTQRRRLR